MIKPFTSLPDYGTRTNEITLYAGPCSVESEEQFNEVAECIAGLGRLGFAAVLLSLVPILILFRVLARGLKIMRQRAKSTAQ